MVHVSVPPVLLFARLPRDELPAGLQGHQDLDAGDARARGLLLLLHPRALPHRPRSSPRARRRAVSLRRARRCRSWGLGVVVAIFSLVGFESSTAFGEESINPLKTIPRSIIWSLILTGRLLHLRQLRRGARHARLQGHARQDRRARSTSWPTIYKVPFLSPLLSAGAMFSFFALASSCMNAGARVMFAMGRHQFFHKATSAAHDEHGTPHVALARRWPSTMFVVVTACRYVFKLQVLDEFNDAGHDGRVRLPRCLLPGHHRGAAASSRSCGELKPKDIALCAAALLLMLIPAVGSVYPGARPAGALFPLHLPGLPGCGRRRGSSGCACGLPERLQRDSPRGPRAAH